MALFLHLALAALASSDVVAPPVAAAQPPAGKQKVVLGVHLASAEYYQAGPVDPVVQLKIIVENFGNAATESTSILWEPSFAEQFVFLESDPPAWRVRRDERGWGVLDTAGVLPHQVGTFTLRFAVGTDRPVEPRMMIVTNGESVVGEFVARASHLRWTAPPPSQQTFERGPVAEVARAFAFLPTGPRWSFRYALSLSLAMSGFATAGAVIAFFRLAARPARPSTLQATPADHRR